MGEIKYLMSMIEDNTPASTEDVLPEAFLGYSKHVILLRAVPDVRDGLSLFIAEFSILWTKSGCTQINRTVSPPG